MPLDYLLFEVTDEEAGSCSFDAMASVLPAGIPGLVGEVEAVLAWAHRNFGPPSADDDGEWGFALGATGEPDVPLAITYDQGSEKAWLQPFQGRVTLTLTVTGSRAFAEAFMSAFRMAA